MEIIEDFFQRKVRFTEERWLHIQNTHPEMVFQKENIYRTLKTPDEINVSNTDVEVELFYKRFTNSPVGDKFLCVLVKNLNIDLFVITAYFTDKVKKGNKLWKRK